MSHDQTSHRCDKSCTCPKCGGLMYYSRSQAEHACIDPACEYAAGEKHVAQNNAPAEAAVNS